MSCQRARQVDHLLHQLVQPHRRQRQLRLALAVEILHARHGVRDVLDGALDGFEVVARPGAQAGLLLQQRLGVEGDGRQRVVDVVGDAARHLAQCAQAFLLHHRLLQRAV
jgi:hypothetical protein